MFKFIGLLDVAVTEDDLLNHILPGTGDGLGRFVTHARQYIRMLHEIGYLIGVRTHIIRCQESVHIRRDNLCRR